MARVREALAAAGVAVTMVETDEGARTAVDAARALGVEVGQIASSLVFADPDQRPVLVITSGAHRVDVERVAASIGVASLSRVDAAYVKAWTGFSIGSVSPVGWRGDPSTVPADVAARVVIDESLADYPVLWAAGGHPHVVFSISYDELRRVSGAVARRVAADR